MYNPFSRPHRVLANPFPAAAARCFRQDFLKQTDKVVMNQDAFKDIKESKYVQLNVNFPIAFKHQSSTI